LREWRINFSSAFPRPPAPHAPAIPERLHLAQALSNADRYRQRFVAVGSGAPDFFATPGCYQLCCKRFECLISSVSVSPSEARQAANDTASAVFALFDSQRLSQSRDCPYVFIPGERLRGNNFDQH